MRVLRQFIYAVCCFVLLGCQTTKSVATPGSTGQSAQQLFTAGEQHLINREYTAAIRNFEALDGQYPFSVSHRQMLLDLMYAYARNGDAAASAVTAGRYIQLYPRGPNVDYAYYMKGLANFKQKRGLLHNLMKVDPALRDLGTSVDAYNDFSTFIRRFPKSSYVADARQRMIYLRNLFAAKELHAGMYYYRHKAYVAAANRAGFIIQNYPQAPVAEKALRLLHQSNQALGLHKEAADAARVLRVNYPQADPHAKLV
jgi:outer membrane protein assembly factor BamD